MILQQVWTLKVDRDESLPTDVHTEWIKYHTQLPLLNVALATKISRIVYWTDSTIVLHWISSSSYTLKTFVANRVAEIQTKTNTSDWRHVPTDDNPADLISRGQTPKEFLYGLTAAHNRLIKILQSSHFAPEIRILQKSRSEDVGGKLHPLNPFLDEDGLLRVGGRLTNSAIPFRKKHPIILPKSPVTELIIEQEHRNNHHTGTQATLYAVRLRYWPIDGRSQVWRTLRRCVQCCRANPAPVEYLMGDLPEARITESRPFTNVGIDYCGPFYIKEERRDRNRRKIKTYAAIFVCLATKAVHVELVSDLTTDAFLAALRRFISRRGYCATILTDNGTNFVGANRELQELRTLLQSDDHQDRVQNFLADRQIQWRSNPPNSPHFGGLWEVAVKAFKRHLIRVVGTELLSFEHLNTLVIEIEAILNSRPLTPISSDPQDPPVLTPGHFLIGDTLTSLRERDFRAVPSGRLSSWQRIHQIKQHCWSRWYREYLNELTRRNKWDKGKHNIREGTVVILREDNVPSMQWPLGRVIKVHPGADGIIRTATAQAATSILDCGVKRLVPLPIHTDPDEAERPHGAKEVTNDTPDSTARI
uniref:uncharacterized protein LOC117165516 n=1 Tax=Bombus vancouverensis nearcticus TaxID=2705178 RepID=UPI001439028B|nr:uncharacterized protein LOC117165516 [Bombus vancouverensis nearcticus]